MIDLLSDIELPTQAITPAKSLKQQREDADAPVQAPQAVLDRIPPLDCAMTGQTLDELDAEGGICRFWSEAVSEWVVLASEKAILPDVGGLVVYRVSEARRLVAARPDAKALRTIHESKRVFDGVLLPEAPARMELTE